MKTARSTVTVIAEELAGALMGCCDQECDKVWVTVGLWHWRRAYLTGAQQFADASGLRPDELVGEIFMADVPLDPPPAEAEVDEHLQWDNIELSPPIEDVKRRLGIVD